MATFGAVKEVEDPKVEGSFLRTFIRVRMEINVNHPLPIGCWIPGKGLPKLWVIFRFKRLHNLCFKCGIIGHEQKNCKKEKAMSSLVKDTPLYDSKLSVPPPKSLAMLEQSKGDGQKLRLIRRSMVEECRKRRRLIQWLRVVMKISCLTSL